MKIVRTISELQSLGVGKVGFVPTMGALHDGHLSLIRTARRECDFVVVSIFVNPLQFGPGEDFERYPRNEKIDSELARDAGADLLFAPSVQEIYPKRGTTVHVPEVSELWEGAHRPGHFDGVATVVCKLFHIVGPDLAYFGLKDFQQCAVIGRMVDDLNMPVALRFCETIREPDGLAMSSRNAYLSPQEREAAPEIHRQLIEAASKLRDGRPADSVLSESISALTKGGFRVDYFALVDAESLRPIEKFVPPAALVAAAKIGQTRLIDNLQLPR